jgi:hypothetical protein
MTFSTEELQMKTNFELSMLLQNSEKFFSEWTDYDRNSAIVQIQLEDASSSGVEATQQKETQSTGLCFSNLYEKLKHHDPTSKFLKKSFTLWTCKNKSDVEKLLQ